MAVLGLRFHVRAFSSCSKRGSLFIAVRGPLTIAASPVAEHRLQMRRLSNCGSRGLVAPRHVGSSHTRARTRVPCIGRQILNHCATREALLYLYNKSCSQVMSVLQLCLPLQCCVDYSGSFVFPYIQFRIHNIHSLTISTE